MQQRVVYGRGMKDRKDVVFVSKTKNLFWKKPGYTIVRKKRALLAGRMIECGLSFLQFAVWAAATSRLWLRNEAGQAT